MNRPRTPGPKAEPGTEATEAGAGPPRRSLRSTTGAYFQLTKPRIVVLLLITTVPTMVLAAGGFPSVWLILSTLFGGSLAAGGANAMNQFFDRDIDELMRRTRTRPLPAHRIPPENALGFGYLLGIVSFFWFRTALTIPASALGFETAGAKAVLRVNVDDYAEVWVNGEMPRSAGRPSPATIQGFNMPNRLVLGGNVVSPGDRFEIAVFAINGPISAAPANFLWFREAKVEFFR